MRKSEKKIAIEFDKRQYETLVRALAIAGSMYGVMSDMVDEDYGKEADAMDDLESWILAYANEFSMAHLVEIFEGENVLNDDAADKYTDDLIEYEDWAFWDVFAHKLADREIGRRYKPGELKKMDEFEIMRLHFELEEKYEREFDEHGIDRFEIKED